MPIPLELTGQKYLSLTSYRKTGVAVPTPVWFGEDGDQLFVVSRSDSGKSKRIRNRPQVLIAPCTIRGKITGPEFEARARILPEQEWARAKSLIHKKYWLSRLSFGSKKNVYIVIENILSSAA
ncbi:MAG: PPOX class F420-dependent oxidoreductase [Acidobacteriota bacterium]|jgi:PPOX class probable F420-dependent enzyme|nr:PPOX class F420-dependent oxidoreductase [Acidobacteriota bacterium]